MVKSRRVTIPVITSDVVQRQMVVCTMKKTTAALAGEVLGKEAASAEPPRQDKSWQAVIGRECKLCIDLWILSANASS